MVNVLVAIKPEPQGPVTVSSRTGRPVYDPETLAMSPISRNALTCALNLAAFEPGSTVTVATVGVRFGEPLLREALGMGADRALLVNHPLLEESDGLGIARALAAVIERLRGTNLLVTGARTRDRYAGQVGPQVAALLGWPVISHVRDAAVGREGLKIERLLQDGRRLRLRVPPPAVLTVSDQYPEARWATGWGITAAYRKPIDNWGLEQLDLGEDVVGPAATATVVQKVEAVASRERAHEVIEGEPEEAAALLHRRLSARGLVR